MCHGPLSDLASVHTDYGKLIHDISSTSLGEMLQCAMDLSVTWLVYILTMVS